MLLVKAELYTVKIKQVALDYVNPTKQDETVKMLLVKAKLYIVKIK